MVVRAKTEIRFVSDLLPHIDVGQFKYEDIQLFCGM